MIRKKVLIISYNDSFLKIDHIALRHLAICLECVLTDLKQTSHKNHTLIVTISLFANLIGILFVL